MLTRDGWLTSCREMTTGDWRNGWSDDHGPDFKTGVDTPAHHQAVQELCLRAGLQAGTWAEQVHGGTVLKVDSPGLAGQADALWTDRPGLGVIGRSADCPLILLTGSDEKGGRLAGFAHASWRSTVRGITAALTSALVDAGAEAATLMAVICPSAGPCCYEVGNEVRDEAIERLGKGAAAHFQPRNDRQVLDLWAANTRQLVQAGLSPERVYLAGHCTICGGSSGDLRYASYRRQGHQAGRFAAVVGFSG